MRKAPSWPKRREVTTDEAWAFVTKAILTEADECVNWPWPTPTKARPNIGGQIIARYVCEYVNGAPFDGAEAAHNCGNGQCINPRHIRWATHAENMADKQAHGTDTSGERHGMAKLSEDQVRAIRLLYPYAPQTKIAERMGVSAGHVNGILHRRSWKHLG